MNNKSCLIDVISKEHALKNRKKLLRANIETLPYGVMLTNKITGETFGHACLLFHYKGDTWHYDSLSGSTKVFPMELTWDISKAAKKAFSLLSLEVIKTVPLDICTMFEDDDKNMLEKINS